MTKPIISVLLPSIRYFYLEKFVESLDNACTKYFWELIIVGPYPLPKNLDSAANIRYIKDFGSPNRCQQIAAYNATGKYLVNGADDGLWVNGAIDELLNFAGDVCKTPKDVITTKYCENDLIVQPDSYYKINNAYPRSPHVDDSWWIFNSLLIQREYFEYLGGWDSIFQTTCFAHADLAIRGYRDGANVHLFPKSIINCTWQEGYTGDHGPVAKAFEEHDSPLYKNIYNDPNCINRIRIPFDNWKRVSSIWQYRFKT